METKNQLFFREFNEALVRGESEKILASVTDDIVWRMVGNDTIKGIDTLAQALEGMNNGNDFEQEIEHMITHGKEAAVNGLIHSTDKNGDQRHYSFCDIYKLNKHKDGKIKEIISYVLEI
ncbi:nuclear transport factor 2 family protein [Gracilibacillus caseinilyticus]|uniref:Nuclear transport factor 2 family protein n=1 Tax=Gracilibacillus caseinilyticus TaxID=2932256 RepID=A0ABY4EXC2_9BACI|nr:nuclear transport factor 2 family protein [Gracilibacillus caseinilyticus]UOQ49058.1 nuclear transport factor 2 family protein [Gracilibacillus caseinilyticus]